MSSVCATMPRLFCVMVFLMMHFPGMALGQQSLFNVPSAEITPANEVFFQQQINFNKFGAGSSTSNTTISYGLDAGLEIGLNVFALELLPEPGWQPIRSEPLFLCNFQKGVQLSDQFKLGLGTQIGETVPERRRDTSFADFTYFSCVFEAPDEWAKLYVGSYFANDVYRGQRGADAGVMLGYDVPVVPGRFSLMGDHLSGTSGISVAVLGGVAQLNDQWQFSAGIQLPSPGSHNSAGAVLEFTYIPAPILAEEGHRTDQQAGIRQTRHREKFPASSVKRLIADVD